MRCNERRYERASRMRISIWKGETKKDLDPVLQSSKENCVKLLNVYRRQIFILDVCGKEKVEYLF